MTERILAVDRMEHVISVFGSFDQNLRLIESALGVNVTDRDDQLRIAGEDPVSVMHAEKATRDCFHWRREASGSTNRTSAIY